MAKKVNPPIDYTSRDFTSIKNSLVNYAKKYYPNTANDFNEASFGALMIDMVSYIGDILSFYLDYQSSESFLDTASEYGNIIRLAKQLGYEYTGDVTAYGTVAFFVKVPANASGLGPDESYIPILRRNSRLRSEDGTTFILTDSVDFKDSENQVLVSDVDSVTGNPTHYAIKAYGEIISGDIGYVEFSVGEFSPFPRFELEVPSLAEVLSVVDGNGNEYFEVPHLAQNIIYKDIPNTDVNDRTFVPKILKPVTAARRFTIDRDTEGIFIQFGQGATTDALVSNDDKLDPNKVALKMHGKKYISDTSFDPTILVENSSLGVAPENTTVRVVYRTNLSENINVGVSAISQITNATYSFDNVQALSEDVMNTVKNSIEVNNEEPVVGTMRFPTADEIKIRAKNAFASQNRAVTKRDYVSIVNQMPVKFGAIERSSIEQDKDSFKRNLNLYVISTGLDGTLMITPRKIKANLKNWINQYKMINDTLDIVDANIVNLGITYKALGERNINKNDLLQDINFALENRFSNHPQIGESFFITDVYNIINDVPGVIDAVDVEIFTQTGTLYSDYTINLDTHTSPDGRFINIPHNAIWEIKFIDNDIKGTVV